VKIQHKHHVAGDGSHDWTMWRRLLYYRWLPDLWRQP
jgi:hypothetical protein